ncbi:MAG: undecaprenyl-diphosphate phosphatase [Parvularculaceae bacterium]
MYGPRDEAARFSMLLAIPTISAFFGLFAGIELVADKLRRPRPRCDCRGAVIHHRLARATIVVFMRLDKNISFTPFVIYRTASARAGCRRPAVMAQSQGIKNADNAARNR